MKTAKLRGPLALLLGAFFGCQWLAPASAWGQSGGSIAWGPQIGSSGLSAVNGATDEFEAGVAEAVVRAARNLPNGASQSSLAEAGRTSGEMRVAVIRDEGGNLVYELAEGGPLTMRAPGPPSPSRALALFAAVPAYIEPDPSSYPHDLLGLWANEGEAGAFWTASPSIPAPAFSKNPPKGRATHAGDAVGLYAAEGRVTKFVAEIEITVDFTAGKASGRVMRLQSFDGKPLSNLAVTLAEAAVPPSGAPFTGPTTTATPGEGHWSARWSDPQGATTGGTFSFTTTDGNTAALGAYYASANN